MISDSPPDRELEWTDEGIQSSKNLINRIDRYFQREKSNVNNETIKEIEKYIHQMENNILNFTLNKCVANIYTLMNFLEKNNVYLSNHELSRKLMICLYPILPRLTSSLYEKLFQKVLKNESWPIVNKNLLEDEDIVLPVQIKGKLITTIKTKKDYNENVILDKIYQIEKVKNKINNKKIIKVINVQNKIINIITL